ncbi:F-box/LRR-repeat protein At3g26922 [Oryza sativa Japonica Group]|uniref:Os02g0694100 protein n=2 Tax=Oryza sativa subsp. japonica TaxID=39947 RepID=A0A5S6RA48_ORYSJ|nr:hypothetical protein DAI22_02g294600 [Oryza sativa Japonica Group]USI00185.1 F-box and FBD domain-containing protein [Oryza sativa Japonica Group]BAD07908.1 hypothetical protein [Oryza sativa Japonica Group]BAF09718.2 Os02g0694100 [Oryza sativa Japonica Group]BAS80400.1 Os02g0694100 [Oryza sativa Japonica Group]|eukprot:NP_001047804.2 Os02g0694100 [Oryza sativa Japonica Group]
MRTKHLIPHHAAGYTYARAYATTGGGGGDGGDGGGGGDPFEQFPEAVLGLIVSKLPFRSAVAASAISRRWRGVAAAAPALDLDFAAAFPAAPRRRAAFAAAATAALSRPHHPLRRLRLGLDGLFDQAFAASAADHLASWLAAAAARGVEQLELHLPRSRLALLPPSLIACTNLTSLTLRLDHYAHPLPSLCSLTRLSRLHLASIPLAGDDFFADLFSHCKQLRYLILEQCRIGALCLAGTTQLCSLAITDCSWTPQSSVAFSDMPALRTLHYLGAMATRHIIDNVDSLEEVVLAIKKPQVKLQEPNLRELLSLVGNVQSLMLSPWCIEQFARPEEWSKVRLNKVRQLSCIIERREEGASSIAPLLANCQNVEELSVSVVPSQCKRRWGSDDGANHWVMGGKGVVLRHLRAVRMVYIDESKSGLDLVKLLLKNTPMLEMMTIVPSMDGLEQAKFRRRVLKLRKASRDADIQFSATG